MGFLDFVSSVPLTKTVRFIALVARASSDGEINLSEAKQILAGALDLAISVGQSLGVDLKQALEEALEARK